MPFALAISRQTLFALLGIIAFVSIVLVDHRNKQMSREIRPLLLVGRFNQGQLRDVSSVYDDGQGGEVQSDVLRALRRDGHAIRLLSEAVDRDQAPAAAAGTNRSSWRGDEALVVPRVVHYVFLGSDLEFTLVNYLSILSVERFVKPAQVLVHGDTAPGGRWWDRALRDVKNLYHVKRAYMDTAPNERPLKYMAHASDYIRADILMRE